jgi:hypothetical protein
MSFNWGCGSVVNLAANWLDVELPLLGLEADASDRVGQLLFLPKGNMSSTGQPG